MFKYHKSVGDKKFTIPNLETKYDRRSFANAKFCYDEQLVVKVKELEKANLYEISVTIQLSVASLDQKVKVATITANGSEVIKILDCLKKEGELEEYLETECALSLYQELQKKVVFVANSNGINVGLGKEIDESAQLKILENKFSEKIKARPVTIEKYKFMQIKFIKHLNTIIEKINEMHLQSQLYRKIKILFYDELVQKNKYRKTYIVGCEIRMHFIDRKSSIDCGCFGRLRGNKLGYLVFELEGEFEFKNTRYAKNSEIEKLIHVECAQKIYNKIRDKFLDLCKQNNLALAPLPVRDYKQQYKLYREERRISRENQRINGLVNDASYCSGKQKYIEAMQYLDKAFAMANEIDDEVLKQEIRANIFEAISKIGYYDNERLALFLSAKWGGGQIDEMDDQYVNVNVGYGTPLHVAIKSKKNTEDKLDVVKWLLDHGADPELTDKNGKKPQDYLNPQITDYKELQILFALNKLGHRQCAIL